MDIVYAKIEFPKKNIKKRPMCRSENLNFHGATVSAVRSLIVFHCYANIFIEYMNIHIWKCVLVFIGEFQIHHSNF